MPRGRRAANPVIEESPRTIDEVTDMASSRFEETDDELDAVQLSPEDIYEDNAAVDETEEPEQDAPADPIEAPKVAESVIDTSGLVEVSYIGTRIPGRAPNVISVIIPDDGTPADEPVLITSGVSFTFRLNNVHRVTEDQAAWLAKHPVHVIEQKS